MQRFLLVLALAAVLGPGLAVGARGSPARPALRKQFEVLAHIDPKQDLNGNVRGFHGYAYLASYAAYGTRCEGSGIRVFDLRNPRRPERVAAFGWADSDPALQGTYADQVRLQHASTPFFRGDLAAIGLQRCRLPSSGTQGFALYDVTDPVRPRQLSIVNTYPSHGAHELWLQAAGNHAYVYTALARSELHTSRDGVTPGIPDFQIWDVSRPTAPVKVGEWGIWTNLGIKPTEDEFVHSVTTNPSATRAYLSYWDFGTVILDISDPSKPVFLGRARDPSKPDYHAHSTALIKHGRVLIDTPEYGRFFNFRGPGFPRFWDISNPAAPRLLTTFVPDSGLGDTTVHDTSVIGNRAYFSWYDQGVYAVDLSSPARPRVIAHFVPPAKLDPDNPFCRDCPFVWEARAYGDYVLASDVNSGLWVLHVRCLVPDVRRMTLRAARSALAKADCRAGRVHGRKGRVVSQSPSAGARPAYPGRISLTLAR